MKSILIGDNPFQGVSHVSQEKALQRGKRIFDTHFACGLIQQSLANGATGFTFTISEKITGIITELSSTNITGIEYYPLLPNINEMVRQSGNAGGIPGLVKNMVPQVASSLNGRLLVNGFKGIARNDPGSLLKVYLLFEYNKLRRIFGKSQIRNLKSICLHEVITDMALALGMEWLFRAHIELMGELGLKPGFETRNLPHLANQFKKWSIDPKGLFIEAPFNAKGFQMYPSREDCEKALDFFSESQVIAISVLAAGYLNLPKAFEYISSLEGLGGVAIGVSNQKQAESTFSLAKSSMERHRMRPSSNSNPLI